MSDERLDDPTPPDDEWLTAAFGKKHHLDLDCDFRLEFYTNMAPSLVFELGRSWDYGHVNQEFCIDHWTNTRGNIRRLCALLGKPIAV